MFSILFALTDISHIRRLHDSRPTLVHLNNYLIIGKEFQKNIIRGYLDRSIQKKLFCHLQLLQIKTFF